MGRRERTTSTGGDTFRQSRTEIGVNTEERERVRVSGRKREGRGGERQGRFINLAHRTYSAPGSSMAILTAGPNTTSAPSPPLAELNTV